MTRHHRALPQQHICGTSSLPSLPENEVYDPDEELPQVSSVRSMKRGRHSRIIVVPKLIAFSSLLIWCATSRLSSRGYRRLTSSASSRTLLFDDGTLYAPQYGDNSLCEYLTHTSRRHTEIKKIHLHIDSFNLEDYLGVKLIANAAQVPLEVSGILPQRGDDPTRDSRRVGHQPQVDGKNLSPKDLCRMCATPLCQDYLHLLSTNASDTARIHQGQTHLREDT
jgi:hypothetical protein